jgi:sulfite reductase (NADPH) flavoprotein alpha-component
MRKLFFDIHWFLGIFLSIFLLLTALSGAVLSFQKEITHLLNPQIFKGNQKTQFLPSQIVAIVEMSQPKAKIRTIVEDTQSIWPIVYLMQEGEKGHDAMRYVLNTQTHEVSLLKGEKMFQTMNDFHRRFLAGTIGKNMVAITTISLLVLVFSGIYLYWKKIKRDFFGSFKVDFRKKGRGFLYQLHSAIGMWLIPWYLLACLTGLYWSYGWYADAIHKIARVDASVRSGGPGKKPNGGDKKGSPNIGQILDTSWIVFKDNIQSYTQAEINFRSMGKVITIHFQDENSPFDGAYHSMKINPKAKRVESVEYYDSMPLNEKIVRGMSALHGGEFFGWIGRVGLFVASIGMLLFVITGFMLYFDRKKRKSRKI